MFWLYKFWFTAPISSCFDDTTSIIDTNCTPKQNYRLCVFTAFEVHCVKSLKNVWQRKKKMTADAWPSFIEKHESLNILRNNFRSSLLFGACFENLPIDQDKCLDNFTVARVARNLLHNRMMSSHDFYSAFDLTSKSASTYSAAHESLV